MRRAVPPPQGEGFLSRWSRLKREPEPAPVPVEPAPPAAAEPALPEGKTLDDLIAELPKIEELVPGQSLAAFMQPWVPTPLRNAALQRMWLLDPAIRDYVSPALDYAYDYNTREPLPDSGRSRRRRTWSARWRSCSTRRFNARKPVTIHRPDTTKCRKVTRRGMLHRNRIRPRCRMPRPQEPSRPLRKARKRALLSGSPTLRCTIVQALLSTWLR